MTTAAALKQARNRAGITLTEILIAIMILAVGLASLATLFPLGLLRLREAARSTRSAYLMESAAADIVSRGLLTNSSFGLADQYNVNYSSLGLTQWFITSPSGQLIPSPLTQDTPGYVAPYLQDYLVTSNGTTTNIGANSTNSGGYGLPFAYDPLWRYQTVSKLTGQPGYYLGDQFEARFGSGLGFIQADPAGDGYPPSAHGLQRLTNFNRPYYVVPATGAIVPIMPVSTTVPSLFVSPEDVVWVENVPLATYDSVLLQTQYSPILPDMSIAKDPIGNKISINDWHYSWMFTGAQNNGSSSSTFDGNIVIFENRPFGIEIPELIPGPHPGGIYQAYQVEGETVVEAIWGYSTNITPVQGASAGYGTSANRAVLLRWYASEPDPVVHVGDWIADVTYERNATVTQNRFLSFPQYSGGSATGTYGGLQNAYNNGEWDNLPAQRCFWYRVVKAGTPAADSTSTTFRSMVVYVDRTLQARTPMAGGQPVTRNAALICPSVVNVIPQTIFTR